MYLYIYTKYVCVYILVHITLNIASCQAARLWDHVWDMAVVIWVSQRRAYLEGVNVVARVGLLGI